jgi:hypothetical protein
LVFAESDRLPHTVVPTVKPFETPVCVHCESSAFVRAEQVISGRRVVRAYYCGRCDRGWQIDSTPPMEVPERRQAERRKHRIDSVADGVEKQPAPASLRPKPDRQVS